MAHFFKHSVEGRDFSIQYQNFVNDKFLGEKVLFTS